MIETPQARFRRHSWHWYIDPLVRIVPSPIESDNSAGKGESVELVSQGGAFHVVPRDRGHSKTWAARVLLLRAFANSGAAAVARDCGTFLDVGSHGWPFRRFRPACVVPEPAPQRLPATAALIHHG